MPGVVNVSVVVPTYKEAANLGQLTKRLFAALKKAGMDDVELLIVDDNSPDDTSKVCKVLKEEGYNIRLIVRTKERGLSSAVLRGFDDGFGSHLICMDADLQHPPETVPDMIKALRTPGIDFTLGTRYGDAGGVSEGWPLHRRIISGGARMLARPLSPLSDPMTGFFGITRATYESAKPVVSPIGYKIALELYVKSKISPRQLKEVSFVFGTREEGESKLTGKVMIHYIKHLYQLYLFKYMPALVFLVLVVLALLSFAFTTFIA
eukprot:TRINITY_DN11518_c0_g1_i1.p2 TRINITY_DN11518_c0_g1~~TRINITY_DN11518_c0_g1_i1.p2  ORF type:complete len:264 (+),score=111.26 TRINITY_DN11518_c0_g1_i1:71-862(+)